MATQGLRTDILEEIHASLGLKLGMDTLDLLDALNNMKKAIKQDTENIENKKVFYSYQLKIIHQIRKIDEEINIVDVVEEIMTKEPQNAFYICEQAWLDLSNKKLPENFAAIEEKLKKALEFNKEKNIEVDANAELRLGSLYLLNSSNDKALIQKAKDSFLNTWKTA
mmetsp:Transcript_23140/g.20060  ORF Transcript_23140/g.20060 Transcript_23140/m.20060 type:complete len:167 (+) Transcript_23140:112-612(+)